MAKRDYSAYQQKVIKRYYDNREAIDHTKLAELCTTLYLATGKKRAKSWEAAEKAMTRIGVPAGRVKHVLDSDDPAELAKVVEGLEKGTLKLETNKRSAEPQKGEPGA
ncbi:MAG: hypothetical protein AAF532_01925 [Planctomycetota bacterium]